MKTEDNKVVLYDSTKPHAEPRAFDSAPFAMFVNSYPVEDQQRAVSDLVAGRKDLNDLGPLINDPEAMIAGLPTPDRAIPVERLGEMLRSYPKDWAGNAAKKVIRGEMSLHERGPHAGDPAPPRIPDRGEIASYRPTSPGPEPGETLEFTVEGPPPTRTIVPLGVPRQKHDKRFRLLRKRAIEAMDGRAPHKERVLITVVLPQKDIRSERGPAEDYGVAVIESLIAIRAEGHRYDPVVFHSETQVDKLIVGTRPTGSERYTVMVTFA